MPHPPVIILGVDSPIGLTLIRELGEHGVPVYGIGASARSVGLYSRYLTKGYIHARRDRTTVTLINQIAEGLDSACLMTVSEDDILFLNQNAAHLPHTKPLYPTADALARVLDKASACRQAQQVGLQVPDSLTVESIEQLRCESKNLTYPVILKWACPEQITPLLQAHHLEFHKAEYCYDEAALIQAMQRYAAIEAYPMLQSFCPGQGLGQMILMHDGKPILQFQHLRLHEWPPEGGVSTLCQSVALTEHTDLMARSVALLQRLKWQGPAQVEYRFDARSGRAVFMEINGRFWGSQPLAYHAGAHFAWATYQSRALKVIARQPQYRPDLRCRYAIPEIKRLARILFQPKYIQNKALRFNKLVETLSVLATTLNPKTRHYLATSNDPKPALVDLYHVAAKAVRRIGSALRQSLCSLIKRRHAEQSQPFPSGQEPEHSLIG